MKDVGQSCKDPLDVLKSFKASLLTPKATLKLLYQIGRTANVTREFRNYNLNILGLDWLWRTENSNR